ncbi:hypothetical protein RP20_CCG028380 [Aedes albopictus]|nr:hypothetical protein RP20_CCG028380 [Aedes albopictus]
MQLESVVCQVSGRDGRLEGEGLQGIRALAGDSVAAGALSKWGCMVKKIADSGAGFIRRVIGCKSAGSA